MLTGNWPASNPLRRVLSRRTICASWRCSRWSAARRPRRANFSAKARRETAPFPRAALIRAQIAESEARAAGREAQTSAGEPHPADDGAPSAPGGANLRLAERLLRQCLLESPQLLQEELPHLLRLVGPAKRDAVLGELVSRAEAQGFEELKSVVFAAVAAGLVDAPPLRASIEKVFSQDPLLQAIWRTAPAPNERMAHEIGALLAQAEKYRCNECGFSGRSFYWHCPACHAWDSFEACAVVKLR